jgi:5-methylcytosine-specific restriction endonuclease McrA
VTQITKTAAQVFAAKLFTVRKRPTLSKELQLRIFRRDKWVCRWCNRPVIFPSTMRLIEREIRKAGNQTSLSYYHAHWTRDGAPLLDELGAVIDHVEAHSTGGSSDERNLATACCKCNGRKSSAPLDEWGTHPQHKPIKGKYGEPQHWDGLSALFVLLAERDPKGLTASEKEWLKVLCKRRSIRRLGYSWAEESGLKRSAAAKDRWARSLGKHPPYGAAGTLQGSFRT